MSEARLYMLQRLSAMVLAPLVLVHLVTILIAVRGGLSAGEILARTQGSALWGAFYGLFVVAVAVHASIGLRTIAGEWLRLDARRLNVFALAVFVLLLLLGGRAVAAVVL